MKLFKFLILVGLFLNSAFACLNNMCSLTYSITNLTVPSNFIALTNTQLQGYFTPIGVSGNPYPRFYPTSSFNPPVGFQYSIGNVALTTSDDPDVGQADSFGPAYGSPTLQKSQWQSNSYSYSDGPYLAVFPYFSILISYYGGWAGWNNGYAAFAGVNILPGDSSCNNMFIFYGNTIALNLPLLAKQNYSLSMDIEIQSPSPSNKQAWRGLISNCAVTQLGNS